MKLSVVLSCLVFTGCGAADPAFLEQSVEYVVSGGKEGSSEGSEGMDAGRAEAPVGSTETGALAGAPAASPEASPEGDSREALVPRDASVVISDASERPGVEEGGTQGEGSSEPSSPVPLLPVVDQSSQLPAQCRALGGAGTRVHVVSRDARIENPESTVIVAHVNGNRGSLHLVLDGARSYKGICVLANGNQARVTIDIGTSLGQVIYAGRGNQSAATLFVRAAAEVKKGNVSLAGNAASLEVDTGSREMCAAFSLDKAKGKGAWYRCE